MCFWARRKKTIPRLDRSRITLIQTDISGWKSNETIKATRRVVEIIGQDS
jgi:hypothetical protein